MCLCVQFSDRPRRQQDGLEVKQVISWTTVSRCASPPCEVDIFVPVPPRLVPEALCWWAGTVRHSALYQNRRDSVDIYIPGLRKQCKLVQQDSSAGAVCPGASTRLRHFPVGGGLCRRKHFCCAHAHICRRAKFQWNRTIHGPVS